MLQTDRVRKAAALKIQSYYRSHFIRQKHKSKLREEFDGIRSSYRGSSSTPKINTTESMVTKKLLTAQLLNFFDVEKDGDRIVSSQF